MLMAWGYQMSKYSKLGQEVGSLVDEKQKAYGDSFNKSQHILRILFPHGVGPHRYRDLLTITRIIDKLFRIANEKEAFGESPYQDIAGYALLGTQAHSEENQGFDIPSNAYWQSANLDEPDY